MKVTFFSNFLNHHQLPFCLEMINILGDNFKFVATEKIPDDRIALGYEDMNYKYNFVVRAYDDMNTAVRLANESDVVIIGSAPQKFILNRLKKHKLVFRYSERIYKEGFNLRIWLAYIKNITLKERKNSYLLCASAYTASDFSKSFSYFNRAFKWGYFPEVKEYKDINKMIAKKENNSILWVARFIELKHPEVVIEIAKRLKKDKKNFKIRMIGIGDCYEKIESIIKKANLENEIKLLGSMTPEEVREYMEISKIFLFTSDKNEGWGAVLNESMNSACAVIASHAIGSVPFLIDNNKNGIIYKDGDIDDLYSKVKLLLDNNEYSKKLGLEAYNTIINLWNPKVAAKRIVEFSEELIKNNKIIEYNDGPCSKSIRLKDDWYIKKGDI